MSAMRRVSLLRLTALSLSAVEVLNFDLLLKDQGRYLLNSIWSCYRVRKLQGNIV